MSFYIGMIDQGEDMHVDEVEDKINDTVIKVISVCLKSGFSIVIDKDINKLEAMADQMGLAFVSK